MSAASAAHADLPAVRVQNPRELEARELASLAGVEDSRCIIGGYGFLDRLQLSNLGMEDLEIRHVWLLGCAAKYSSCPLQ